MEDLEQIMRKIHVLFAKCETYGKEKENKIIVPKKEVFRLLEQLNFAVMNLMDQYEGTEESRERGLGEYRRKGQKIIEEAQAGAEDIYAASLVYTDNMINGLEDVLSEAKESLRLEYARMAKRLNEQAMMLETNQAEIKEQLLAMSQGEKYLNLILRENRRRQMEEAGYEEPEEEELEEEDWDEEDDDEEDVEESPEEIEDEEGAEDREGADDDEEGAEDGEVTADEENMEAGEDTEGAGGDTEDKSGTEENRERGNLDNTDEPSTETLESSNGQKPGKKAGKPNGKKKKGGQKSGGSKSGKTAAKNKKRVVPDLEKEWEEEQKQRSARKVGTALYQDVGQPYDPPPKKVSYEIKVNEAYFEQLGEGNIDLDAEYEQWKKEQEGKAGEENGEGVAGDTAATIDQPAKKEKRRWFGKKKQ